ncbi:hypothetical protein AAG895_04085 [Thauera sp. JM12B12]|uniref:hypothetical protein n=1 Tax=Thauera sp. JM12B12 TaxID=3142262 RepID=UPI0031F34532
MIGDALMDSLGGALGGSTAAGTLPPPRAKVSRGGGAPSAGGFGADLVALLTGPAQPDPLTAALVAAEVRLLPAPALSACRLRFLPGSEFPALAAGDVLKLQLGAGDDPPAVFTGPVTLIGGSSGVLELVLGAAAAPLTRVRRNAGYENQGFADLMKLWAGEASLTPGDIDAGPKYAFLAIDAQGSLWEWMARLGQAAGVQAWMDAEGRLNARAARGQPVATWGWGRDLLGLQAELHDPAITAFAGLPTGKAKEGAWSAGEKPASGAAPGGGGAAPGGAGGLAGALGGLNGAGAKPAGRVHITVPGCPALDIASPFALEGCPGGRGDGDWVAVAVEHRFAPGQGFITRATGVPA